MTPAALYGANTPDEQARTARMVAEREGWSVVKRDDEYDLYYKTEHVFPFHSEDDAWEHISRDFDSTDAILALLARDGWCVQILGSLLHIHTRDGLAWRLVGYVEIPNQHPATISHALRCLWLAAKGESK